MKTLSLLQPWASLVGIGAKRIETRSWRTDYRGPLLIAASKSMTQGMMHIASMPPFGPALQSARQNPFDLPLGSILCLVDLVDVVRITADNAPPESERSFGDYTPGRYAWHLANVRRLHTPVPANGQLGLWTPDPETLAAVMAQLKGVTV